MRLAAHTSSQYMLNIIPDILKVKYMQGHIYGGGQMELDPPFQGVEKS